MKWYSVPAKGRAPMHNTASLQRTDGIMHSLARTLFVAICCFIVAGCATPEERAAAYTARAQELFAAGKLEEARVEARNAVQIEPKNTVARYLLVLIAEQKNDTGELLSQLAVVVEEDRKNAPARVKLGTLLVYAQDYEGAALLAEEAMAMAPDDPAVHVLKARLALQKNDLPASLASLDRAIELDPGEQSAAALRAVALSLQDPLKALADLEASIARVGPPKAEALRKLRIDLLNRLGRNDEVERELRVMLEEFGGAEYSNNLALLLTAQERYDDAMAVLRDAVARAPDSIERKVSLAQYQSKYLRKPEEAEKTLRGFIAEDPDNQQIQTYLGNFLEGTGRADDAIKVYEVVVRLDRKTAEGLSARSRIAALLLQKGDLAAAEEQLDAILEDQPDLEDALLTRADIHSAFGRHGEAIADLRGVLRRSPDNVTALLMMADAHQATGNRLLAEDAYRRILLADAGNVEALTSLARLLAETGQLDEAGKMLDAALARDPQSPKTLEALVGYALAKKDLEAAEKHARALAALSEGIGQRELGRVLEAQQKFVPASEAYRKSLAAKSDSFIALEGATRTLQVAGRGAEAAQYLQTHLEEHPDHIIARVLLGGAYLGIGKPEEARAALNLAIDQQPRYAQAYIILASSYPEDPAARIDALKRGLEAIPAAAPVALLLAGEHQAAGRVDDAIAVYEKVIAADENRPQVANNLAALLLDYRQDAASHKRALELARPFAESRQPTFLDTLGWAHYRNKDYDSAIRFLELAVAYGRNETEARYHLAKAYLATENTVGARQELEKALKDANPRAPWVEDAKKTLSALGTAPAANAGQG